MITLVKGARWESSDQRRRLAELDILTGGEPCPHGVRAHCQCSECEGWIYNPVLNECEYHPEMDIRRLQK